MKPIHIKDIPNLPSPNQDVSRRILQYGLNVDGYEECITIPYQVQYFKNGKDVSDQYERFLKPMQWRNSDLVYVRTIDGSTVVNPEYTAALAANQLEPTIPNPDYISKEETPDLSETIPNPDYISNTQLALINEFLVAPAFDYFVNLFHEHPGLFWNFLDMYIDENYDEGWYGNIGSGLANR